MQKFGSFLFTFFILFVGLHAHAGSISNEVMIGWDTTNVFSENPEPAARTSANPDTHPSARQGTRRTARVGRSNVEITDRPELRGEVFETLNNTLVSHAVVRLFNHDGSLAKNANDEDAIYVTDEDGRYTFRDLLPGHYYLSVMDSPLGLTFPSQHHYSTFDGRKAGDASYGKDGVMGDVDSGVVTVASGGVIQTAEHETLVVDIPLDVNDTSGLFIEKTAEEDTVEMGGFVRYTVTIRNGLMTSINDLTIHDKMPRGFRYVTGSSTLNDKAASDPENYKSGELTYRLTTLDAGKEATFSYLLQVTPAAREGDVVNEARVSGRSVGGAMVQSLVARAIVKVKPWGVLSNRGLIIGRVFLDFTDDGKQQITDIPVAGARIFFQDGTQVITDEHGSFSLYGIKKGRHVARLDMTTIPEPLASIKGKSQFIEVFAGQMVRADFPLAFKPARETVDTIAELHARRQDHTEWVISKGQGFKGLFSGEFGQGKGDIKADGDASNGRLQGGDGVVVGYSNLRDKDIYEQAITKDEIPITELFTETVTSEMAKKGTWAWPKGNRSYDGNFMVIVRTGVQPTLTLNDEEVPFENLGEQFINREEKAQVFAWYGLDLKPGKNILVVSGKGPFGNMRELAKKEVMFAGPAAKVEMNIANETIEIDGGRTRNRIDLKIVDKQGLTISGKEFLTLSADQGEFLARDMGEGSGKVPVIDGMATVYYRGGDKAGPVKIRAAVDDKLYAEKTITMVEPLRPLIAVGLVDVTAMTPRLSDKLLDMKRNGGTTKRLDIQGQGSVFLKGRIKGDALLTFAWDSEKQEDSELFRDINPDEYYPIYGDAGAIEFEAQARSPLYIRLEKQGGVLTWSDMKTHHNAPGTLGKVQRQLTGLNAYYANDVAVITAFVAPTDEKFAVEELKGNGTATFYELSDAPIKKGSEIVTLVKRKSGFDVSETVLNAYKDYMLDYETGKIAFSAPINSRDDEENDQIIRVSYAKEGASRFMIAGTRGEYRLKDNLLVYGTLTHDNDDENGFTLVSAGLEADDFMLGDISLGDFTIEIARMSRDEVTANAVKVSWDKDWNEKISTTAKLAYADEGFDNSGSGVSPGKLNVEVGSDISLTKDLSLTTEFKHQTVFKSGDKTQSAEVLVNKAWEDWKFAVGAKGKREVKDQNAEHEGGLTAKVERNFKVKDRDVSLKLSGLQNLTHDYRRELDVTTTVTLTQDLSLYGTVKNTLNPVREVDFVVGLKTKALGADIFSEYRENAKESVHGIKKTWAITDDLTIAPSIEFLKSWDKENREKQDVLTASITLNDSRNETMKKAIRLETKATKSEQQVSSSAALSKAHEDMTFILRDDFSASFMDGGDETMENTLTTGVAHRPKFDNTWHWFAFYQWKEERQNNRTQRRVHLASTHHSFAPKKGLELSGRLGGKWEEKDGRQIKYGLVDGAFVKDITKKLSIDGRGGMHVIDEPRSLKWSGGLGLSYAIHEDLRLGVGYNIKGFEDEDLDVDGLNRKGFYFGLSLKFDEALFEWLQ